MEKKTDGRVHKRSRIFNIMQYKEHPVTGEPLLSEEKITEALTSYKYNRWAWILHDKDPITSEDSSKYPDLKPGDFKKPHFHIVVQLNNAEELCRIADRFGIPDQYIEIPHGKGAGKFLDCVEYLTHDSEKEIAKGKHVYDPSEVHTSGFEFTEIKKKRKQDLEAYGSDDLSDRDKMRYDVLYRGKTLRQCIEENRLLYMEDLEKLQKLRLNYIYLSTPPVTRVNVYVSGEGGAGKGLLSKAIARALYPELKDDREIFFPVGASGASFEGYDGQPIIIWNDKRSFDLIHGLGGRDNVFNVFESHPENMRQNVKYSSINLCNTINIINSVEPSFKFLDGLAGEYVDRFGEFRRSEDKKQAYRRFPILVDIKEDYYNVSFNKGFGDKSFSFFDYSEPLHIKGNMEEISIACGTNRDLFREISSKMVAPIVDKVNYYINTLNFAPENPDDVRALFADFGTSIDIDPTESEKPAESLPMPFELLPEAPAGLTRTEINKETADTLRELFAEKYGQDSPTYLERCAVLPVFD